MISEKQAILDALEKNIRTRQNTKFARNLLVVEGLRNLAVPIIIQYKDFPKFSFDSICTTIRQVRVSPEGRKYFDDRNKEISDEEREVEVARIEAADPRIKFINKEN